MTLYFSGSETTERESLADTIAVRTPMMTPMLSRLPSKNINNRVHEWTLDEPFRSSENVRSISSPHANSQLEGSDYTYRTPFYPTRVKAICEIQHRGMEISDTDRTVVMAGTESTFDYRSGQLFTTLLNSIDNTLLYGQGSPETSGASSGTTPRHCQGLIHWAAWTGLERVHGTNTVDMMDPYGTTLPASMWSVFVDFEHTNITGESFYSQIIRRITNAGGDMESAPWTFWCGDLMMARVSKFLLTDGGVPIHERTTSAESGVGYDHLHTVRLPNGYVVSFRTNRWLDDMSNTFAIDNRDYPNYTPTSPNPAGTEASRTFSGDQTIIGFKPGSVKVAWLRAPAFEKVETSGDYSRLACKAEFTLEVAHPLDVAGAGNCLS